VGSIWGESVADPPQSDEELARRNDPQLTAFVGYISPGSRTPDREDIVQDAWVKALTHRDSVPSNRLQEGTWLRAVVRNLVRDRWRVSERNRVREPRAASSEISSGPGADELVIAGLESATVRVAFERLAPLQARVLELRILEGRSARETAAIVGRRPDDVRQIQFRAIAALRRNLRAAGWFEDEGDIQ
jgi:RNA polymerase sigma-70 factor (ECF subfamily)